MLVGKEAVPYIQYSQGLATTNRKAFVVLLFDPYNF